VALAQGVQAELVGDLRRVHGVGQILLVREHQQHRVAELILRTGLRLESGLGRPDGQCWLIPCNGAHPDLRREPARFDCSSTD